jgi:glutathione S-transferase
LRRRGPDIGVPMARVGPRAHLDGVLAERKCLAGETFSVADITAFVGLGFAEFANVAILP